MQMEGEIQHLYNFTQTPIQIIYKTVILFTKQGYYEKTILPSANKNYTFLLRFKYVVVSYSITCFE